MIRYQLTCDHDHRFESWFQSAAAFETLQSAGLLSCATCGSGKISKTLMAPTVQIATKVRRPLTSEQNPAASTKENAMAKFRKEVETNSDYVGLSFAAEARAMHEGTKPLRGIYGEANGAEARKLIEDGIPVLPLPFIPRKKVN